MWIVKLILGNKFRKRNPNGIKIQTHFETFFYIVMELRSEECLEIRFENKGPKFECYFVQLFWTLFFN